MNKGDKCFRIVWDFRRGRRAVKKATYVGEINEICSCKYEVVEVPIHAHEVFSTREEAEAELDAQRLS